MLGRIYSLIVYRLVLMCLLLVYQLLAAVAGFPVIRFSMVLGCVIGVSILTVIYMVVFHRFRGVRTNYYSFVLTQFFFDILLVRVLGAVSGGEASLFRFAYLMIIVLSATFLDKIAIYVIMILSLSAWYLTLSITPLQMDGSVFDQSADLFSPAGYSVLLGQTLFCFLTTLLSGFMQSAYRSSQSALRMQLQRIRSLRETRKKIVESLPSGLITCGPDGRIDYVNLMGQRILGKNAEALQQKIVWDLLDISPPEGDSETQVRVERRFSMGTTKKELGITFRPLEMESGLGGYLIVFQDLTKIKLLEAHKLLKDKMAAIGKVAAGVAHEIRNPLASISGSIQVLKELMPEDPDAAALADIVAHETNRLNEIISQFLAYARPGAPPQFEPFDLTELVRSFAKLARNDVQMKSLTIETICPEQPCRMFGDQHKLTQVFWNILRNSFHACKDEPKVEMGCRVVEEDVVFYLKDNGIGMSEEQLKDLFTPFQSFSRTGMGLGMSIVFDIVQMHHGKISVQSSPGEGTMVTLRFKRYEESLAQ